MIGAIDKSDEPRTLEELREALSVVKQGIIRCDFSSPLTIHLTVIKDALDELIAVRTRDRGRG